MPYVLTISSYCNQTGHNLTFPIAMLLLRKPPEIFSRSCEPIFRISQSFPMFPAFFTRQNARPATFCGTTKLQAKSLRNAVLHITREAFYCSCFTAGLSWDMPSKANSFASKTTNIIPSINKTPISRANI